MTLNFIPKSLRTLFPHALGFALALTLHAAAAPAPPAAPEAPADVKGTGTVHPKVTDQVTIHYSGWTTDGKLFDSSVQRGKPASFPLNKVIIGLIEGVQLMVEGEKRRLWIPTNLAYGNTPTSGGRPAGMLVFDVELLQIAK